MSVRYNFPNVVRDDHFVLPIIVKTDGVAANITGWTFWMTFKKTIDETDAVALADGRQVEVTAHTDPTAGETTLTLLVPADRTMTKYYYDVQYLTAANIRRTPIFGEILLIDERTYTAS